MKSILTVLISFLIIVGAFAQTRNVVVGTNDVIVSPTNFWNANSSNAKIGLKLNWSALTNSNASTSLLGYTANGQVIANTGTNVLTFTNALSVSSDGDTMNYTRSGIDGWGDTLSFEENMLDGVFSWDAQSTNGRLELSVPLQFSDNASQGAELARLSRANLGFSTNLNTLWTATNAAAAQSALFGSNTNLVLVDTNGSIISPTNFWQSAPIQTRVQTSVTTTNSTNLATNARNLYLYSLLTNIVNITNTIQLPTNSSTFAGDTATIIHWGSTSSTTAIRQLGASTNLITINKYDEAVKFIYENGVWTTYHNISFVEPIVFAGTNISANTATTRTNLGLSAPWLTNTNGGESFLDQMFGGSFRDWANDLNPFQARGLWDGAEDDIALSVFDRVWTVEGANSFRSALGLGWSALTNSNAATSLLGFTTNGQVVANTGTNVLTFTNDISVNGLQVSANGISRGGGTLDFDQSIFYSATDGWDFGGAALNLVGAISFYNATNNTTNAAITRANLGFSTNLNTLWTATNSLKAQEAIFTTNDVPTNSANVNTVNFNTAISWMAVNIVTNGVTNTFHIPLFK